MEHRECSTREHEETHGSGPVGRTTWRTQEKGTRGTKVHKSQGIGDKGTSPGIWGHGDLGFRGQRIWATGTEGHKTLKIHGTST